jgi:hypothetical protein
MDEFLVWLAPIGLTTDDVRDKGTVSQDCYKSGKIYVDEVIALEIAAALYSPLSNQHKVLFLQL